MKLLRMIIFLNTMFNIANIDASQTDDSQWHSNFFSQVAQISLQKNEELEISKFDDRAARTAEQFFTDNTIFPNDQLPAQFGFSRDALATLHDDMGDGYILCNKIIGILRQLSSAQKAMDQDKASTPEIEQEKKQMIDCQERFRKKRSEVLEIRAGNFIDLTLLLSSPRAIITSYLIAFDPKVKSYIQDSFFNSVFMQPAYHELDAQPFYNAQTFKTYLSHGISVGTKSKHGETPLMAAAAGGTNFNLHRGLLINVMKHPQKREAQVFQLKKYMAKNQKEMVLFSLSQGADIAAQVSQDAVATEDDGYDEWCSKTLPKKDQTALCRADQFNHSTIAKLLINHGAKVKLGDPINILHPQN